MITGTTTLIIPTTTRRVLKNTQKNANKYQQELEIPISDIQRQGITSG
ncbi:hypothetical protein A79_0800 [Vibrio parahaemolyticus AQ3810]|nr:hypothetical protein VPBB_0536 [Vibrio parahaemolyticus BB22OP]AHI98507.1 hypothetical protein VPUCM_0549 [Vibrio parahaemolyticus UCM-V493]ANZ09113.1 hypothetical protein VpaChn25_0512 [Vibrio parahaemolyticus]EDM59387.1 hypothetical protein A79_0800 [Vibrio parahaemolyticus AQ3810]EQL88579.1 hypothetical protein D052_2094 [Vibrio parahaemolyticus 10290]EQM14874.1 hypothetical protein D024_2591 [Vibrio parahaemolyticus 3259]EQM38136.1 hypothetical protein D042_2544 [Vibrio parahaemolyticu